MLSLYQAMAETESERELIEKLYKEKRQRMFAAANQRLHLRAQDHWIEGLRHIIIRANIQAVKGIIILLAAADNDDGRFQALTPYGLNYLKTIHAMHIHVQQD